MCTESVYWPYKKYKNELYSKKSNAFNDKRTDPKVCWTVLNNFLNYTKILSVPPILISIETIKNAVEKANIFNEFFPFQCSPLENSSKIPPLLMNTDKDDINSIIKSLNLTKAHWVDNISIHMIQLCGDFITLPLVLIFKSSLSQVIFPDKWKMANIILVHKNCLVKNYRPISLLPIFAKVFERLLFNSFFSHFHNNNYLPNFSQVSCQGNLVCPNVFP